MPTTRPGAKTELVEIKSFWLSMTEMTCDHVDPWAWSRDMTPEQRWKAERVTRPGPSDLWFLPFRDNDVEGFPAAGFTGYSAQEYCKWLSRETGKKYRLPTEAEWEYACRAGRPVGAVSRQEILRTAWVRENSVDSDGDPAPHPVAGKEPNRWGLYDMFGNLGEWVVGFDGQLVLKGGSFRDAAAQVAPSRRDVYVKEWQVRDPRLPKGKWVLSDAPFAGFRIVRED